MRSYVLRPAAVADLNRAYQWYEQEREGLGEEFLLEVAAAIEAIRHYPQACPVIHRDTRRSLVRRFPYSLLYRLIDETVVFVACFHTRRDPTPFNRRR